MALAIVIVCAAALGLTKYGPKRFRRGRTGVANHVTGELQLQHHGSGGGGGGQRVAALPVVDARVVPDDEIDGGAGGNGQSLMGGVTEYSDLADSSGGSGGFTVGEKMPTAGP